MEHAGSGGRNSLACRPFRLAFVEFATPDLEAAIAYYRDDMGACVMAREGAAAYLSLGCDHHNIALHRAPEPGLRMVGLQVSRDGFDELEPWLRAGGIAVQAQTDARPGIARLLEAGPVAGHTFQLFPTMAEPGPGFGGSGIVPNRIGHVALMTPDPAALVRFLTDTLGFAVTDWFEDAVTFLTCNRDHHVINVVAAPVARLHHLAFELRDRSHHFTALDFLAGRKRPTLWGPSRHTAGHNLASYHWGADRVLIELYADMDVFIPELDCFEPRPWHEHLPLRPQRRALKDLTTWGTAYDFDFRSA